MITIETENYNPISQDFYNDVVLSLDLATLTCNCQHSGLLTWHGSYLRNVMLSDQVISLRIARVYCSFCGHTHAILLSSIVPDSQIPLQTQADIIGCYEQGHGYRHLLDNQSTLDESNVTAIIRSYLRCCQHFQILFGFRSGAFPVSSCRLKQPQTYFFTLQHNLTGLSGSPLLFSRKKEALHYGSGKKTGNRTDALCRYCPSRGRTG